MADPILNQLLEEAVDRCFVLAKEAGDAARAIDDLVDDTAALAETARAECDEAHGHFGELAQKLEQAEGDVMAAVAAAKANLDGLVAQALAVQGKVGELLARVKTEATEIETEKTRIAAALEQKAIEAEKGLSALDDGMDRLSTETQPRVQTATLALESFRTAVDAARDEVVDAGRAVSNSIEEAKQNAGDRVGRYTQAIDESLADQATLLVEIANRMLNAHNDAVVEVRKKFVDEAAAQIGPALAPVRANIEALTEAVGPCQDALTDKAAEIQAKFAEVTDLVEQLRPILEQAGRL